MFINFFAAFILVIICNGSLFSEELSNVLYDAYNYYPDIEKSKKELQISEKDLKISKTDFLPSVDFSASRGKDISKTFFKIYLDFYLQDKIFEMKFKTDCQALDATRKIMKKNPYYKETNRGDGLDGHVIFRDKEISVYIDHRKGRRKFEKIENKRSQMDHNIKHKVNIFKKMKVNIKNFIFKKLQK